MDGAATPSTIAEATGLKMAHSSRSLKQLRERGMVELLVSESVFKGRVYGLTDTGKAAWTLAEDEEML
jgi:DNA-binding MarR family transcriptional regulator